MSLMSPNIVVQELTQWQIDALRVARITACACYHGSLVADSMDRIGVWHGHVATVSDPVNLDITPDGRAHWIG
jgi:hypothetical protein